MLCQIVRVGVGMSGGVVLGIVPGTLYACLVGVFNFALDGPWDEVPAFPVGGVMVGALFGLLGGIGWALSDEAAPAGSPPPTGGRSHVTAESPGRNPSFQALAKCLLKGRALPESVGREVGALAGQRSAVTEVRGGGASRLGQRSTRLRDGDSDTHVR